MWKKRIPVLILAGACLLLLQCSMGGGESTGGGGTQDPIVGVWVLSSVTGASGSSQTPALAGIYEVISFRSDRAFLAGMEMANANWGGPAAMCAIGTWTPGASGSYAYTAYPSGSGGSAMTGSMTLGGSTLTVGGANPTGTDGPYTFTFIKSSTTPSSSDPVIGTWVLTTVNSPTYGLQTAAAAGCAEVTTCLGDGSFLMGLQLGPDWSSTVGCGAGTWTAAGPGNYTTTAYPSWSTTAWAGTMNLTGGTLTAANIPGPGGSSTFTFTKNPTSISSSDPLIGTWVATSVKVDGVDQTPLQAGITEAAVFQSDGSCMAGMQFGGSGTSWGGSVSTGCAVGTWAPGAPGTYVATSYPSTGGSASTGSMTLSGSILTAAGFSGGGGHTFVLSFTKQ